MSENQTALDNFTLNSEKQVNDRTSIIIAANAFLFTAFATLAASATIKGILAALPIIICAIGIGVNTLLSITNRKQIKKIREKTSAPSFAKTYFDIGGTNETLFTAFNNYGPILLIIGWALSIAFYAAGIL